MDQMQEAQAHIEQLKAMGIGVNTIQAAVQSTYAGGTTSLGLNRWSLNDKPTMEDFNRDNEIIDQEIRALRAELANKADKGKTAEFPTTRTIIKTFDDLLALPFGDYLIYHGDGYTAMPYTGYYYMQKRPTLDNVTPNGNGVIFIAWQRDRGRLVTGAYNNGQFWGWRTHESTVAT